MTMSIKSETMLKTGQKKAKPRVSNMRPVMLFGNFQIITIYIAKCLEKRCREII